MSSFVELKNKPHAVCITIPAQGHINPMFKLAKILHHRGFHITFVYTESNHPFLQRSKGANKGSSSFRFETIPDGLPSSDDIHDADLIFESIATSCLLPFKELLCKLNSSNVPPVSCIICDAITSFTLDAAQELGIPEFIFWPISALSTFTTTKYSTLVEKGYLPLKDESCRTNGYLNTLIEDVPGLENMRLRDISSLMISENQISYPMKYAIENFEKMLKASGFIINTFENLEPDALEALQFLSPSIYPIGPLHLLEKNTIGEMDLELELGSNPWIEDSTCLEWLDSKEPNSVLYVNFGTTSFISHDQLIEFAWGLADSNHNFLWIIRPNLVYGQEAILPKEFLESTKERCMVSSWVPQDKVLSHHAIGGFLTHSGWNSTLESISSGVPMICWPSVADQLTNCWSCTQWGIGLEMNNVNRDEVSTMVKYLFSDDKGKEMKNEAMKWKKLAHDCSRNSSLENLDKVINQLIISFGRQE